MIRHILFWNYTDEVKEKHQEKETLIKLKESVETLKDIEGLFCVGMVLMMIVDLKNLKLFSLILGNYMLMMITLLTGMIYKNECIYWYSGVSYQEAIEATSMSRKKYAYKHFIRFFITCLLYLFYSIIAYFLSFSFGMNMTICCLLIMVCALSTTSIKL